MIENVKISIIETSSRVVVNGLKIGDLVVDNLIDLVLEYIESLHAFLRKRISKQQHNDTKDVILPEIERMLGDSLVAVVQDPSHTLSVVITGDGVKRVKRSTIASSGFDFADPLMAVEIFERTYKQQQDKQQTAQQDKQQTAQQDKQQTAQQTVLGGIKLSKEEWEIVNIWLDKSPFGVTHDYYSIKNPSEGLTKAYHEIMEIVFTELRAGL